MADSNININKLMNPVNKINAQINKKIDSQNNNINKDGKSFEEILSGQRANQKPVNNNSGNIISANDIQRRQYALNLNIRPYEEEQELTFSKHAKQRLAQRNIDIDSGLIEKISGAVKKASEKSIKNALVLSGESAFIVSVDNSVVVTAMNNQEMRESVITNIDGTVIL